MKKHQFKVKNQQEISIGLRIYVYLLLTKRFWNHRRWLSDSVIYSASVLLAQQVKDIDRWQTPQCENHFQYKPVNPRQRFIQILHDNGH